MKEFLLPNKLYIINYIPILVQKNNSWVFLPTLFPNLAFWGGSKVQLVSWIFFLPLLAYISILFLLFPIMRLCKMHQWSCHFFRWVFQQLPISFGKAQALYWDLQVVIISLHHKCSTTISLDFLQTLKPLSMFVFSYICSSAFSSWWSPLPPQWDSSITSPLRFSSAPGKSMS